MNPIKWTIFWLVLEFVLFFWLMVFSIIYREKGKCSNFFAILTVVNLTILCVLSFQIPYSIYWFLNYWRW